MNKIARRRWWPAIALAVAAVVILAKPLATRFAGWMNPNAARDVRTVKVWFGRYDFVPDDAFASFMRDNPAIRVQHEVIRLEDASAQLVLALRAGTAPDIVQIYERDVLTLAAGGALKDISAEVAAMKEEFPETFRQLAPITWEAVTDGSGRIFGASLFNMSIYLTYRKDWLAEAGVNLPLETTDQVLDAARKLAALKGPGAGFALVGCCVGPTWELPLFRAMGGGYVDAVPQIDNPIGVAWIGFYQKLMRDRSASPDTSAWDSGQMRAAFIGGRAGIMHEGEHIYVELQKRLPYESGVWGFAKLPMRPGQTEPHVQTGFGFPHVVTAGNTDPDAAMRVLAYLGRKDIAQQVAIRYQPTSNLAVSEDPAYRAAKPWAEDIAPISAQLKPLPSHPTRQIRLSNVLTELRDRMVAQPNADPRVLAAEYQAKLNAAAGL
jgi:ABC-type glycerol-3-phosphate transport system substrate-binding protein